MPVPHTATRYADAPQRNGGASAAIAAPCTADQLWVNALTDRTIVHLAQPGATSFSLQRTRTGGAAAVIATVPASADSATVVDRTVNPRATWTYVMTAFSGTSELATCVSPADHGMSTSSGYGQPDLVGAASDNLVVAGQDDRSTAADAQAWLTPTYSADGRLLAAADLSGEIVVRSARTLAVRFTVAIPNQLLADPAFSPDGQTMAFSRYSTAGDPLGLGFVPVHGTHTVRQLTTTWPVVEPAYRRDGTIVASAFDSTAGLASLCPTCTAPTIIPGTDNAYTPEVGPDGSIYFATTDANPPYASLLRRLSGGTFTTLASAPLDTDWVTTPRVSADGRLFYQLDSYGDPASDLPTATVVRELDPATGTSRDTGLTHAQYPVLYGFDVRQPQTKGSSHVAGDRAEDILAIDASGGLWAYTSAATNPSSITGRTKVGSGWLRYPTVVSSDPTSADVTDLLAVDAYGALWFYQGRATGGFASRVQIGAGWRPFRLITPGDWNGDDMADLLGIDSAGALWLYPGLGTGRVGARKQIGSGWSSMSMVSGAPAPDLDNDADLIGRDVAGALWLYPGNGVGGFAARRALGTGWTFTADLLMPDITRLETTAYVKTSTGLLRYYRFMGDGTFADTGITSGSGWSTYRLIH